MWLKWKHCTKVFFIYFCLGAFNYVIALIQMKPNRFQLYCGMEWVKIVLLSVKRFAFMIIQNNLQLIAGDTCCFSFSLGSFKHFLEKILGENSYVKSIQIGSNLVEDFRSGYFVHPNKQIEDVCQMIASDPQLKDGYNAVGFSQGSQFLYVIQLSKLLR